MKSGDGIFPCPGFSIQPIFSTTNPENRYIKLTSIKSNNNLRDLYIRTIMLGGQKEELYQETDKVEISKAFGKIGKVLSNG